MKLKFLPFKKILTALKVKNTTQRHGVQVVFELKRSFH